MEVEAVLFIGSAIIAVTQAIKYLVPQVNGAITIAVAVLIGLAVSLIDKEIGVSDLSVAEGIMTGLASSGVVTVARNV
jgi:high-affinity Fe2+/Pb2+ permease